MNDYILTYVNGHLTVTSGTDILYSTVKPELEFEFEALFYETPTDNRIKVVEGASEELTEEEIEACKKFCKEFLEKGDYFVEAYEKDSRLYKGRMLKSAVHEQHYGYALVAPLNPVSKWTGEKWERIAAVIRSDGSYVTMPEYICDACVLFFTESEWAEHSKPSRNTEQWDFASETWKDSRTVEQARSAADAWIRGLYVAQRTELMGNGPYQELASWPWQVEEAKAWIQDNRAATPFLDGVLEALNSDERAVTTKEVLVQDVLKYTDAEWLKSVGKVHGEMYANLKKLRQCETLQEIDALTDAVAVEKHAGPVTIPLEFVTEENGIVRSFRHTNRLV